MKITKRTVKAVIENMKNDGNSAQEIENNFKDALRAKLINLDVYCMAIEEIYA